MRCCTLWIREGGARFGVARRPEGRLYSTTGPAPGLGAPPSGGEGACWRLAQSVEFFGAQLTPPSRHVASAIADGRAVRSLPGGALSPGAVGAADRDEFRPRVPAAQFPRRRARVFRTPRNYVDVVGQRSSLAVVTWPARSLRGCFYRERSNVRHTVIAELGLDGLVLCARSAIGPCSTRVNNPRAETVASGDEFCLFGESEAPRLLQSCPTETGGYLARARTPPGGLLHPEPVRRLPNLGCPRP